MRADITICPARREDCPLILEFIHALAEYEALSDQVSATPQLLEEWLFDRGCARALLARAAGEAAGFALYFYNFSSFLGRGGIYLEDLYVKPAFRGQGIGRALMERLAALAVEQGCGRLEWSCLDWNSPGVGFYRALGALPMEGWTTCRLTGLALNRLARGGREVGALPAARPRRAAKRKDADVK